MHEAMQIAERPETKAKMERLKAELEQETECGNPHNNGDETCFECQVVKSGV